MSKKTLQDSKGSCKETLQPNKKKARKLMSEKMKYDTKWIKRMLLDDIGQAWYELGRINRQHKGFDEELIACATREVLENNKESKEQYKKLLGFLYMVRGITSELQLLKPTVVQMDDEESPF